MPRIVPSLTAEALAPSGPASMHGACVEAVGMQMLHWELLETMQLAL